MDIVREQREELYRLRKDLQAVCKEVEYHRRMNDNLFDRLSDSQAEVKHQAELAVRLTIWMCRNDYANEAAEIVGKEAVEAIVKTLPADDMEKCYD